MSGAGDGVSWRPVDDAQTWIVQEYCDAGNMADAFLDKGPPQDDLGQVRDHAPSLDQCYALWISASPCCYAAVLRTYSFGLVLGTCCCAGEKGGGAIRMGVCCYTALEDSGPQVWLEWRADIY